MQNLSLRYILIMSKTVSSIKGAGTQFPRLITPYNYIAITLSQTMFCGTDMLFFVNCSNLVSPSQSQMPDACKEDK